MVAHNNRFSDEDFDYKPTPKPKVFVFGDPDFAKAAQHHIQDIEVSGDLKNMMGGLYHALNKHTNHVVVIRSKEDVIDGGVDAREIWCTECNEIVFGMVAV